MRIASYQGISLIPSRIVRFVTRSVYSHSAFVFDSPAHDACLRLQRQGFDLGKLPYFEAGSVVEAWSPLVRNVPSISEQHTPGTVVDFYDFVDPLGTQQEEELVKTLCGQIGEPYDWKNVLKFISKRPTYDDEAWFCSEMVYHDCALIGVELLARTKAWEVSPGLLVRSRLICKNESVVTK